MEAGIGAGGFENPMTYPSGGPSEEGPRSHESTLAGDGALVGTSMGGNRGVWKGLKTEGSNTST